MASEFEWDSAAFTSGLKSTFEKIRRGTKTEEERLGRLVVDQANPPVLTGDLKSSGFVRKGAAGVEFGWASDHAGYVEYGTEDTPAQPFGRPSIQRTARQLKSPI